MNMIKTAGKWAIGADEAQWMLYRAMMRKGATRWRPVAFVSSTKDVLAQSMREKGLEPGTAIILLEGLPDTFQDWKTHRAPP